MARILAYDLHKPYKMVVSQIGALVIQNGIVYEKGSGRALGPVADQLKSLNPDLLYCKFSGATFPNTADGKIALQKYQERKGYIDKPSDGTRHDRESTIEERKAEVKENREKFEKGRRK